MIRALRAEFAHAGEVRTKELLIDLARKVRAERPDDAEFSYSVIVDCIAAYREVDTTLIRETAQPAWQAALKRAVFVPLVFTTAAAGERTVDDAIGDQPPSVERIQVLPRSARLYQTLVTYCNEKSRTPHCVSIKYRDIAVRLGYRRWSQPDSERAFEDVRAAERDQILICLDPGEVRITSGEGRWPIFCLRGSRETVEAAALNGMLHRQYINRRRDNDDGILG